MTVIVQVWASISELWFMAISGFLGWYSNPGLMTY